MRIVLLIPENFKDYDKFKECIDTVFDLYGYNCNPLEFEYIYPICNNENFYRKFFKDYGIKNTFGFKPNWNKYKAAYYKNILTMVDYAIEDDANLMITFQDFHKKLYHKNLKKINKQMNIFVIDYTIILQTLDCCNQEMLLANMDDYFDYLICECCNLKLVLLQELTDKFIQTCTGVQIIQKRNYMQGEM